MFLAVVGWVANNVLNYEMVLATGEVVNANSTHNTALFKALKGGGSNFGVLTHVDVAVIRERRVRLWRTGYAPVHSGNYKSVAHKSDSLC